MFTSKTRLVFVLVTLALSACAAERKEEKKETPATAAQQVAVAESSLVEQVTHTPNVDIINKSLAEDNDALLSLASFGAANETERSALNSAREKIELVKAARDSAERHKRIAVDARNVYAQKLQAYQQTLADAEASRKARARAMTALAAAQKELDDAWASVAAARDAHNKIMSEPASTATQKSASEAALSKANARAAQAATALDDRTAELQALQQSGQAQLQTVATSAADAATAAGVDYAAKAGAATRALEQLNLALAEEKKAMALVHALNRARAKAMTEALANAAFEQSRTATAAGSAQAAAQAALAAKRAADSRLDAAVKADELARSQAAATAEALRRASLAVAPKAAAKADADSALLLAQKEQAAAKAAHAAASSVSTKSASEAWRLNKAATDAAAKAQKTRQSANWAAKVHAEKNTPESAKSLETWQAALAKAEAELEAANNALTLAKEKAAADSAATAAAKAELDAKAKAQAAASAAAALAAREKAAADAQLAAAQKTAAQAQASSTARAAELERARAAQATATQASELAEQKSAAASQAATAARQHYDRVYSNVEAYKLSPTRSEQEELSDEQKLYAAALWAKVPEGNHWTSLVIAATREHLDKLETARDLNDWCPGYFQASEHQREVCWLRLFGGLVKFESNFKGGDKFHEGGGVWSIGLMALSPNECKGYETEELLKKPILNLRCGIGKFARLVERDGYIDGPERSRGAAAYWSTLRAPYTKPRPNGDGHYNLGKKNEIRVFTTVFRNF